MFEKMNRLESLEAQSIYIIRESYAHYKKLCMLWSIGKDSTVMLWLMRKAFFGHTPIPLLHIDTKYKIPEMIEYRDKMAMELKLTMIIATNDEAPRRGQTFPQGNVDRIACCKNLKTIALKDALSGQGRRYLLNTRTGKYEDLLSRDEFTGVIVGIRADEEGSRSKERYFSPRDVSGDWLIADQPPEFWNQYKTDFKPGTHVRIHPLLDWTEIDIWHYILRESIPTVSSYYDNGEGKRYRSLGCYPCTFPVESHAQTPKQIIDELVSGKFSKIAERSGRAQDAEDAGTLETLRRDGYM